MGRRPNQVVLDHFVRGEKIKDNSNRYKHTCRNCGQEFDKGRHEQLTAHMTDECTSLTDEERARILLKLHGLEHAAQSAPPSQSGVGTGPGRNFSLPFSPSRPGNFDGLNVLAEASRRVGIQQPKRKAKTNGRNPPLDPALAPDLPNQFVNASDDDFDGYVSATSGFPATSTPAFTPLFSYMPAQLASGPLAPSRMPRIGINLDETTPSSQSDLPTMAASANETLAQGMLPDIFEAGIDQVSDAGFGTENGIIGGAIAKDEHSRVFSWSNSTQPPEEQTDTAMTKEFRNAATFPTPIAMNTSQNKSTVFVEETGTSAKSQKAKQRSAFNPQRKKEVQEMRLRGVCIRCKMLKKPCGIDTPCKPCREIDNSRLWGPCSRWDFKKDLRLYTTPLHSSLAQSDLNNIKNQISFLPFDGHIIVSLLNDHPAHMEVPAQQGQHGSHALHPQYGISMQRRHYQKSEDIFIFSISRKDFTAKLQQYLEVTLANILGQEKSSLICSTLLTAHKLANEKEHKLLQMVLELWVLTYLLSATDFEPRFEAVPANMTTTASPPQIRQYITKDANMYSHSLLSSQLRAAIAERASEVKKKTMATFEAQFMKGPTTKSAKTERFETFLASVILVNSAERYMWLFRVFEEGLPENKAWPLDVSPAKLAQQAEKVAAHLEFMLRVRHVSPGTRFGEDGLLKFNESVDENSQDWFRTVNIRHEDLNRLKQAAFNSSDFTSLDGQYFSNILSPWPTGA